MSLFALLFDVLVIGQYLLGADFGRSIEAALRAEGIAARVQTQERWDTSLSAHWVHATDATVNGRALIAGGTVGALILADAIRPGAVEQPDAATVDAAATWHAFASGAYPAARVMVMAPWSAPGSDLGLWAARIEADHAAARRLADAVNAARLPEEPPMLVVPAGPALVALADRIAAGGVPGLTSAGDLFAEGARLNDRGEYLVAALIHAAVTRRPPDRLPERLRRLWTSRATAVTPPMAAAIRAIAWQAARAEAARPVPPPAAAPAVPAAAAAPLPEAPTGPAVIENTNLALGLAGVHDWSVAQPFVDVFRTARAWTGHLPGQFGGWGHEELAAGGWLDPETGWLRGIPPELTHVSALILTDLPAEAVSAAGRYRVTWAGKGTLRLSGGATLISQRPGEMWFSYTPNPGTVMLDILAVDPDDPIRDIVVVHERNLAAYEAGEIFDPLYLSRLRGVRMLRFMDWAQTNNSPVATVADLPRVTDYQWTRRGVPLEIQIALANRLGADAWFNVPHLADDALIRHMAETVRDRLDPSLTAYVEFSNEVWNFMFAQAEWAEQQGRARWGRPGLYAEAYALRTVETGAIWAEVFGEAAPARLRRVIATQTGWIGREEAILNAPTWAAEVGPGFEPPWKRTDAYAVAGYFGSKLGESPKAGMVKRWIRESRRAAEAAARAQGLTGSAWAAHVEAHRFDLARARAYEELRDGSLSGDDDDSLRRLLGDVLTHHARLAAAHGHALVMYEGGQHLVGIGNWMDDAELTEFFVNLNFSAEMGALYRALIDGWAAISPAPFMDFGEIQTPGRYGSWGALRHPTDDNPRWRALVAAR